MGQNVCCMKQSDIPDEPKRVIQPFNSNCSTPVSPTSRMIPRKEQTRLASPTARKLGATETWTLERCLMNSPEVNISECTNNFGGDNGLKVVKRYQKIDLSSPDLRTDFFTPRLSFSSDKLGLLRKIDEEDEGFCGGSLGGKVKKRVSFKLPEEADIIIFYSPREKFEEY
ncbi:hypothetical protein POM88_025046 [Heracleum sosnowskyi]|uniref:Uncharacterized protein n=1 Tax=Heracleum sosnowskyi TaxID=360622 RepID=A0AAD8MMK9_9APIA|nr:hypothetical protein POM88_025046 [Heracleum sosnowskyi]